MVGAPSSLLGFLESFLSEWGFKPTPPFGERNSCLQEGHYLESVAPPSPPRLPLSTTTLRTSTLKLHRTSCKISYKQMK